MSDERRVVFFAGRPTWAHITPLIGEQLLFYAPATHRGVCLTVEGIVPDATFDYGEQRFAVFKAWDESREQITAVEPTARARPTMEADPYHQSRVGKFTDVLLIEKTKEVTA